MRALFAFDRVSAFFATPSAVYTANVAQTAAGMVRVHLYNYYNINIILEQMNGLFVRRIVLLKLYFYEHSS